jgi:hypothetical protein
MYLFKNLYLYEKLFELRKGSILLIYDIII